MHTFENKNLYNDTNSEHESILESKSNKRSFIDPQNSFIDKLYIMNWLRNGVTLNQQLNTLDEKSRVVFIDKSKLTNNFQNRKLSKQEYANLKLNQSENYLSERINERLSNNQSIISLDSKQNNKDNNLLYTSNIYESEANNDAIYNIDINKSHSSQSWFELTPRINKQQPKANVKLNNESKSYFRNINMRSSRNKIIENKKDSLNVIFDETKTM